MLNYFQLPEFWASHYYLLIADEEYDSHELIQPFFGISNEAVERFYSETLVHPAGDPSTKPIRLPIVNDFSVEIEYADCGDKGHETRYFINHSFWKKPELLGYNSPHFALPVFRWSEIDLISRALHKETGHIEGAVALLLLFPAVWLTGQEDLGSISEKLRTQWDNLSLFNTDMSNRLIRNVINHSLIDDLTWWEDQKLGWINNGQYSFRNPKTLMCEFEERRFKRLSKFFESIVNLA